MRSRRLSARTADRFKDEVYRQMLRLESGRAAALPLAVALLEAWTACDGQPANSELRQWLRAVCPVCVRMMTEGVADAQRSGSDSRDRR